MIGRRQLIAGSAATGILAAAGFSARASASQNSETFEIMRTEAEWRKRLTPAQFNVLRRAGTEAPGSSPLDHFFGKGTYSCAGCDLPLYRSETKFDSGTGWPSFWRPIDGAVRTSTDNSLFVTRTEVHCRRCGSHLGHVFNDGPKPTGLRYCMNGIALKFRAA